MHIAVLAVTSALLLQLSAAAVLTQRDGVKVMIVGDSISQGHEGDYTWRYRLWEWFKSNNIAVDFVGPYIGTVESDEPKPPSHPLLQGEVAPTQGPKTSGGYAVGVASDFDSNHLALWGRQAAQVKGEIASQVATYSPDYLLIELGFNDLGWFVSGPEGTLESIKSIIDNARSAKPDIKFALANVPMRSLLGGRDDLPIITDQYNALLANAIPQWSTSNSPIEAVLFRENYQCEPSGCPAAYDGLHPNALGEFQIAQAFSRTLHEKYGLGSNVLSIPASIPARPCPVPSNFKAVSAPSGIVVTWDKVYGFFTYNVRTRVKGAASWGESSVSANRVDTMETADGIEWEYQIRASCGDADEAKSDWTGVVSAVAHPKTAPGPKNIVTQATSTGLKISWEPPDGTYNIDRYELVTFDKDTPGAFPGGVGIKGNSAVVDGLLSNHRYAIIVYTWTDLGRGLPSSARSIKVGKGTPSPPSNVQIWSRDPTTVKVTYNGDDAAAEYRFWTRNINNSSDYSKPDSYTIDTTCRDIGWLFPGTWNYEFCISALNGNAESAKSACVVGPSTVSPDVGPC